jgi:hypothetical protein
MLLMSVKAWCQFHLYLSSISREFERFSKERQVTQGYVLNNITVGLRNLFGEVSPHQEGSFFEPTGKNLRFANVGA